MPDTTEQSVQPNQLTIIVEGTPHPWGHQAITYAQVVTLEFPDFAQRPNVTYTVTYEKGPASKPKGSLVPGASVDVVNGMAFHVTESGQS